jgi:hypothetical protein
MPGLLKERYLLFSYVLLLVPKYQIPRTGLQEPRQKGLKKTTDLENHFESFESQVPLLVQENYHSTLVSSRRHIAPKCHLPHARQSSPFMAFFSPYGEFTESLRGTKLNFTYGYTLNIPLSIVLAIRTRRSISKYRKQVPPGISTSTPEFR